MSTTRLKQEPPRSFGQILAMDADLGLKWFGLWVSYIEQNEGMELRILNQFFGLELGALKSRATLHLGNLALRHKPWLLRESVKGSIGDLPW